MKGLRAATFLGFLAVSVVVGVAPQKLTAQVNVTTAHQDVPAICTNCVYRTGQNLQENTLTYSTI